MNSVHFLGNLSLFLLFTFIGHSLHAQIPCGINSVDLDPAQIVLCDAPLSVDFNANLDLDTDPVFLYGLISSGNFQSPFVHSFPTENDGCFYGLKVVGSYSIWSNPTEKIDARYRFDIATNLENSQQSPTGLTIPTPLYFEPGDYNEDHEYWFYYEGNGQEIRVDFTDSGQYSDNEGEMNFEWYAVPCYDTTWNVLGADFQGETMRSLAFPNPGSFNVSVTITDNLSGCMDMAASEIRVSEKIETVVTPTESCPDSDSGTASAMVNSGTTPFQYIWDNGGMDVSAIDNLAPGMHQLQVVDANGCRDTTDFEVTAKINPLLTLESADPNCEGAADGSIELLNPEPNWTFSLDNMNFQNDALFQNLDVGSYVFYVQDADGCVFSDTTSLISTTNFSVDMPSVISINRGASETLKVDVIGGSPTYIYSWTPATGLSCTDCLNPTAQPSSTTTYLLTVTDIAGCTASATITINVPEPDPNEKQVFIPDAFSPNNDGINDFLTVFTQNGVDQITTFAVFDRWGGMVFKKENFQPNSEVEGWNGQWKGKTLNTGIYTWFAEIDWIEGIKTTHEGAVTLFREK